MSHQSLSNNHRFNFQGPFHQEAPDTRSWYIFQNGNGVAFSGDRYSRESSGFGKWVTTVGGGTVQFGRWISVSGILVLEAGSGVVGVVVEMMGRACVRPARAVMRSVVGRIVECVCGTVDYVWCTWLIAMSDG